MRRRKIQHSDDDPGDQPDPASLDIGDSFHNNSLDDAASVACPCCGESVEISLDPGSGTRQMYVEDCQVCCQPWRVSVSYGRDGRASVSVTALDD